MRQRGKTGLEWTDRVSNRTILCYLCVGWLSATTSEASDCVCTHTLSHRQIFGFNSTYTEQRFDSCFIISVHRASSTMHDKDKKGGKHKPCMEEYAPFEVVLLLGTSFGVTQLVKQIIKHNGWEDCKALSLMARTKFLMIWGILELDLMGIPMPAGTVYFETIWSVLTDRCYHKSTQGITYSALHTHT